MKIDFVLLWVDGSDPAWLQELNKYSHINIENTNKTLFRDWDNLHYIFRAFEKFTPWVNKIHFVTWGHLPKWLNTEHPKINIVYHRDILDERNMPVFNSNAIEPNIYKIKNLSEKFVLFNDDLFMTAPLPKERFFKDGLPCDQLACNTLSSSSGVGHFVLNNLEVLNRHFDKKSSIKQHRFKWFNMVYGKGLLRNMALLPWPRFTGFVDPHMPQPFLKSTFEEVWKKEREVLDKTSASRFRNCNDVNQYLFRYWQLAKGEFAPISMHDTAYKEITKDNIVSGRIEKLIISGKYSMVCLNDSVEMDHQENYAMAKEKLKSYFEQILPEKSSYEK